MAIQQLTLDSLKDLDTGKVWQAFQMHLLRAAMDCLDRPADDKPRKVVLEFGLKPLMADDGDCSEVVGQFAIHSKVPTHRTKLYSFGLRRNGLVYNPDAPDNVNQATFLEDPEG